MWVGGLMTHCCKIHFSNFIFSTDINTVKSQIIPYNNSYILASTVLLILMQQFSTGTRLSGLRLAKLNNIKKKSLINCYKSLCSALADAASLPGPSAMLPDLPLMQIPARVAGIWLPPGKMEALLTLFSLHLVELCQVVWSFGHGAVDSHVTLPVMWDLSFVCFSTSCDHCCFLLWPNWEFFIFCRVLNMLDVKFALS